ncbi:MAG: HAD-IB family hydrolase [Gammaproteobacteria bacterium]|nr:HAD-IB family hydrolase [Gammaproteobacteria bacterium]
MALAIFDLDNTLLAGDSDATWGEFLVELGVVDADTYGAENERFYQEYKAGTLDIFEFLAFSLKPLSEHPLAQLHAWRAQFIEQKIRPMIAAKSSEILAKHRQAGDTLMIITATNRFITEPIAELLGVPHLLATDPEMVGDRYTGRVAGTPCFQEGKVVRLTEWLQQNQADLNGAWFYSDSHNDLPLLRRVTNAVAVDADPKLASEAEKQGWPHISLR